MKVLVACEFSGIVRDAFAARGHDAWSCDLLPSERAGNHIQGDVFNTLSEGWDIMIFHWPCTYMLLSGVRWFTTIPKKLNPKIVYGKLRYQQMIRDANAFKYLLNCGIPKICGENPTMCGAAQKIIGTKWTQHIQPWQFGHGETKATYLWLNGLPPLVPTEIVSGRVHRIHRMSPGPERERERSRTFQGIASAMAEQWG